MRSQLLSQPALASTSALLPYVSETIWASASVLGGKDAMNGPDVEGMVVEEEVKGGPAM